MKVRCKYDILIVELRFMILRDVNLQVPFLAIWAKGL